MKFKLVEGQLSSTSVDKTNNPSGLRNKFKKLIPNDMYDDVTVHHINGAHPSSFLDKDNKPDNLVILDKKTHNELTKLYNQKEKEFISEIFKNNNELVDELRNYLSDSFYKYIFHRKRDSDSFIRFVDDDIQRKFEKGEI